MTDRINVSATVAPATVIDRGSFSWTILQAPADELGSPLRRPLSTRAH